MESLNRKSVTLRWLISGIADFFIAFKIEEWEHYTRYPSFFYAQGFEKICKACLLAIKAKEYEELPEKQALLKSDKIARNMGHNLNNLVEAIKKQLGEEEIQELLDSVLVKFNNLQVTGSQFLGIMEKAYEECRYPVPNPIHENFPIEGTDSTWQPLDSSGIDEFCHKFCKKILDYLKSKFDISIPRRWFDEITSSDAGRRFCNVLFGEKLDEYVSD